METKKVKSTKKNERYKLSITCSKLKNDLKWFYTANEGNNLPKEETFFGKEKTIAALLDNWWLNS